MANNITDQGKLFRASTAGPLSEFRTQMEQVRDRTHRGSAQAPPAHRDRRSSPRRHSSTRPPARPNHTLGDSNSQITTEWVGERHGHHESPRFRSKRSYTLSVSGSLTSRHSRALVSTTRRYPRLSLRGLVISTSDAAASAWGSELEPIAAASPAGSPLGLGVRFADLEGPYSWCVLA
jgi:hypothetical protein